MLPARESAGPPLVRELPAQLPAGIEELYVRSGRVCLRAAPGLAEDGLRLSSRTLEVPFEALTGDGMAAIPFHSAFALDAAVPVSAARNGSGNACNPRAVCEAHVNALPDWSVQNGQTLQIRLLDPDAPAELTLGATVTLPPHDKPFVFRAGLAAHRGLAEFRLHATSAATGETRTTAAPFDPAKLGGLRRGGYHDLCLRLPPAEDETTLSVSLAYQGRQSGDEEKPPFLFVANPEVTSDLQGRDDGVFGLRVFGKPIDGAKWYAACIPPPVTPGDPPVEILAGGDRSTLFSFRDIKVTLREDYGHTLILTANHTGRYAFHLDGEPAFFAHIGARPTAVHIPPRHLDGETHVLSVRDPSGTLVLLQAAVLTPRILTPQDVLQRESRAPFPGPLAAQASHRYAALRAHLDEPGTAEQQAQAAWALRVLEGGYGEKNLKPLSFPKVKSPDVSVVIPAHNKIAVTYFSLCALLLAPNQARFEVIVVDDASTDETAELEKIVSGINVIHNAEPQRFIRACNAGVAQARGNYVVLLNNDTEPTAGWLDALIDAFHRFDNVGLAGSKLLYPNGKLQDAGGIVWSSGNPWNYGNRQNPWEPRFRYARQADYLSGAALMTTKDIWDEVGGLSSYLEPMYFEDTDFAFKVREAGYSTWFVPSSVVYHYEGMTSGTDIRVGPKRNQEINRPKFKRRWAKAYAGFSIEGRNPDLEKDRGIAGRVLFIDYATPRPDRDAGSYAAVQEIKLVQSLGYKVTFLPENLAHLGVYTEELERDGVEVITAPFYLSVEDFLHARGAEFDAVYITRYYVGRATIPKLRQVARHCPVILNNADLHFLRELRTGLAQGDPDKIAEARTVRDSELAVMRLADVVLSYNEVEHSVIQSHTDGAVKVMKCPWVEDLPATVPPFEGRAGLSFLGSYRHPPNAEGILWFAQEVMPLLGGGASAIPLAIYGSGMTDEIRALKSAIIDPAGFVEDVAEAYDRHRIFIAPLLSGAGIKGKVLAALAHGVPCVLSPVAAEGIGLRHGYDCMIASKPADWAAAIRAIHDDAELWQRLSDNARAYVLENFSFARGRENMRAAFEAVGLFSAHAR